jgi:hypothetical protein
MMLNADKNSTSLERREVRKKMLRSKSHERNKINGNKAQIQINPLSVHTVYDLYQLIYKTGVIIITSKKINRKSNNMKQINASLNIQNTNKPMAARQ